MIVNPGIRRFLGSAIQRLFNSASVSLPLTHTAIPTRGSITPSFTRATTKTWKNNDGYMVTGVAGEIGFVGARRVRNLLTFTEDLSNAAWTKINGGAGTAPTITSGFTDPDGGSTAFRIQANAGGAAAGDYSVVRQVAAGGNLRAIYVKSNTGVSQEIYFGAPVSGQKVTATTSWSRVTAPLIGGNSNYDIGSYGTAGNSTTNVDILVWHPQLEDVTAQTTQTAGEYVSVGVESAPYYHGSFVDGVECFPTDISGNPIPSTTLLGYQAQGARTNLCLQSQNYAATWTTTDYTITSTNNIAPDGTATASLMTEGSAGTATISQPVTATANANYSYYRYIKRSNNDWWQLAVYSGGNVVRAWFNLATGVKGSTSILGTATVVSINMTPANDGWYRCEVNVNIGSGATSIIFQGNSATADASTSRVNGASAYMWGNQFNDSASFASSYIATTTAAVTRNADVLTYSSAGNASAAAGWLYVESTVPVNNGAPQIQIDDGSNNNRILLDDGNSGNGGTRFFVQSGGAVQANIGDFSSSANTIQKRCGTWATNYAQSSQGGLLSAADTSVTTPASFTQIGVGGANGSAIGLCTIRNVRIGQRQLSASELQAVTA